MIGDRLYKGGCTFGIYYKNDYEGSNRPVKRIGKHKLRRQAKRNLYKKVMYESKHDTD